MIADILLNVFLAIAVDNLADAESLTAIEKEEAEAEADQDKSATSGSVTKDGDDEEEENAGEGTLNESKEGEGQGDDQDDENSQLAGHSRYRRLLCKKHFVCKTLNRAAISRIKDGDGATKIDMEPDYDDEGTEDASKDGKSKRSLLSTAIG